MIITVHVSDLDAATSHATYDRVQTALETAGLDTFEMHLQTPEQHAEHPSRSVTLTGQPIAGAPTDEQIRVYLECNPQEFAHLLRREIRRDPEWWRREMAKQERLGWLGNLHRMRQ